jgi:hypothetical protein
LATEVQAPEHDPSGRGCAIAGMANRDDYRGLRGGWSPTDICELCAEPGAIERARAEYARLVEQEAAAAVGNACQGAEKRRSR